MSIQVNEIRAKPTLLLFAYTLIFIGLVLSRFLLAADGSNLSEVPNMSSHIIELGMLGVFTLLYLHPQVKKTSSVAMFFLSLYFYALALAPFSELPLVSAYAAIKGVGYTLVGLVIVFANNLNRTPLRSKIELLSLTFFASGVVSSSAMMLRLKDFSFLMSYGTQGGLFVLFGVFYLFSILTSGRSISQKIAISLMIAPLCWYMNSFSSIIAGFIGAICVLFANKKYILGSALVAAIGVTLQTFNQLLVSGTIDRFGNKDSYSLMTGSGRLDMYLYAWDLIVSGNFRFMGTGFMAEKSQLTDASELLWTHTAHNSFLSLALGLGIFGIIVYIAFLGLNLRLIRQTSNNPELRNITIFSVFSLLAYGLTSPTYPGAPSLLVSYIVALHLFADSECGQPERTTGETL